MVSIPYLTASKQTEFVSDDCKIIKKEAFYYTKSVACHSKTWIWPVPKRPSPLLHCMKCHKQLTTSQPDPSTRKSRNSFASHRSRVWKLKPLNRQNLLLRISAFTKLLNLKVRENRKIILRRRKEILQTSVVKTFKI